MNPKFKDGFEGIYSGKRVLITGHTGFKGAWLALWLQELGAQVFGFALEPNTKPNLYTIAQLNINSTIGDITDYASLQKAVEIADPEIVFHLAAQPLVIESYKDPIYTYATNVMGAVHLFESLRSLSHIKAIVCVTTDKVYQTGDKPGGHQEKDLLGGKDPYSASKACVEIISAQYQHMFEQKEILVATARAGNVLGGGDWAADRILPDLVKSAFQGQIVKIRNPNAIRPWQHVLDCLHGYLMIGQKLLTKDTAATRAWNFGPDSGELITVDEVVKTVAKHFPKLIVKSSLQQYEENPFLALDSSDARNFLNWRPKFSPREAIEDAVSWYRSYYSIGKYSCKDTLHEFWNRS